MLVQSSNSIVNSSIHMMFMWMDLAVFWINQDCFVVDRVLAKRWKLVYLPKNPAMYVLEADVARINDFVIGDKVNFESTNFDIDK